ncbi:MAG: LuxR C-terminal-related transcriptional regulator [Granulosicoccus sp.]
MKGNFDLLPSTTSQPGISLHFGQTFARFLEDLDEASNIAQVKACCAEFSTRVGAQHFLYKPLFQPFAVTLQCIHNFQPAWIRVYSNNDFHQLDPRNHYCLEHSEPIRWCDLSIGNDKKGRLANQVLKAARQHGYVDGITFPLHGVGCEASFFSLSSSSALPEYSEIEIQTILAYANRLHSAVKRIQHKNCPKSSKSKELSEREKDCLVWTAKGKTSWEIGQILGLSESTVVFHISKAVNKLDVKNRVQAVASAITQSKIHLY